MKTKIALIFGSSGLTGSILLSHLLGSPDYDKVKIFVRKPISLQHPKLEQIITDFEKIKDVSHQITGDEIYLCLGTTMAKAGSKEAFYKVDYTYTIQAATLAYENGVNHAILISSMGADPNSLIYYSKVKGGVEKSLGLIPFQSISVVRPSLLLGERKEHRLGEKTWAFMSKLFSVLFVGPLMKYKPITADAVARAMINIASKNKSGFNIYESDKLNIISKNKIK